MIYMFDMDGTLTPARKPMEEDFAKCFLPWLQKNKAFIVTGSDIAKVLEQLPSDVVNAFSGIYCAMGNDLWRKGDFVYHHDFVPAPELLIVGSGQPSRRLSAAELTFSIILVSRSFFNTSEPFSLRSVSAIPAPTFLSSE